MEGVAIHGFKWQLIAEMLSGRSVNAVRNRRVPRPGHPPLAPPVHPFAPPPPVGVYATCVTAWRDGNRYLRVAQNYNVDPA